MLDHYSDFNPTLIKTNAKEKFSMEGVGKKIASHYNRILKRHSNEI